MNPREQRKRTDAESIENDHSSSGEVTANGEEEDVSSEAGGSGSGSSVPGASEPSESGGGKGYRDLSSKMRKKGGRGSLLLLDENESSPESNRFGSRRWEERGKSSSKQQQGQQGKASVGSAAKMTSSLPKPVVVQREIFLPSIISVTNLARQLGVKMRTLQNVMEKNGMADSRADMMLKFEDSEMLAAEFNLTAVANEEAAFDIFPREPVRSEHEYLKLPLRPPVVTIMGHVDHGKTTLLDKLRSTSVAAGEAGGITQHLGAFSVPVSSSSSSSSSSSKDGVKTITFLDTPGHAAFTAMRSRGAKVTDIVVLVVAADDGVMPQTMEVIQLVKSLASEDSPRSGGGEDVVGEQDPTRVGRKKRSCSIQLVVALNKVDKPEADADKVKRQLLSCGVELEEFGGEVPCVEVSGKTGKGLEELEETLATLAELADLRAEREGASEGYVIESKVDKGRGNVATVLVKRGSLKTGDCIIAGTSWCKVRQLSDPSNKVVKSAGPGDPVLVSGWRELPSAGDEVLGGKDEASVKKAVENRKSNERRKNLIEDVEIINENRRIKAEADEARKREEFEERRRRREARLLAASKGSSTSGGAGFLVEGEDGDQASVQGGVGGSASEEGGGGKKWLNLIIKADFSGTVEAVEGSIKAIGNNEAGVKIIYSSVGEPSEGDVQKASALQGHILGFNVKATKSVLTLASRSTPKVEVHCDDVIYRLMEHVQSKVSSLLPPIKEVRVKGEANVAEIFNINLKGKLQRNVAGCKVTNGTITRNSQVRILRGPERKLVYQGRLEELKHLKKDVNEMRKGTECGLSFENFQLFQKGDLVQCINVVEVPRSL
ncbi:initiation factor 2 [Violaceomyces palustris]|uniref:Initiation factor 2 n=1 Tax=Violaceomyces palustris TaxID=1673888 RepID=A0ACD0NZA1_9BASI|nr:initiation factor 2 [Violaceomyces palustris]